MRSPLMFPLKVFVEKPLLIHVWVEEVICAEFNHSQSLVLLRIRDSENINIKY